MVNNQLESTSGTWEAAVKLVAFMAAHDLLVQTNAHWTDVEDQSISATITKVADDKVTIGVQARINKAVYQTQETYNSPQAMRDAANEIS